MTKTIALTGLPIVTPGIRQTLATIEQAQGGGWSNAILRQLKEENPEINSLLLEMAQSSADPKAVVLAGYRIYKLLELADASERKLWPD
jgi:hypothetical protein